MKQITIIGLLAIIFSSCDRKNIDESFKNAHKKNSLYLSAIEQVDYFFKSYNDSLQAKIIKKLQVDFYFNHKAHFNTDIVFSKGNITLIYIEKNNSIKDSFNIYYTSKDPQIFIQELKSNIQIANYVPDFYPWHLPSGGEPIFLSGGNYIGSPYLFKINENSFFAYYSYTITLINEDSSSVKTNLPGISFYIGSDDLKNFNNNFIRISQGMLSNEILDKYLTSKLFRKALIHPKLKEIALEILDKKAKADSKVKEYPLWEFEKDIDKMRKIAKDNFIETDYVDEMFKDPQYSPIYGKLLYFYSNEFQFMIQWTLINLLLFIVVLYMKKKSVIRYYMIKGLIIAVIVGINGWIFHKKPDLIGFVYWIIPGILFITSYLLIFKSDIKNVSKHIIK